MDPVHHRNNDMSTVDLGRVALEKWAQSGPQNYYDDNAHFQRILKLYTLPDRFEALHRDLYEFGAIAAQQLDSKVRENNEAANLPRLERYSPFGARIEKIVHHPLYDEIGRAIYASGVTQAYQQHPNAVGALSRFYISSHLGEAGHNCPLACVAGMIRSIQELGTSAQKERYLSGLTTRNFAHRLDAAQFLTEVQGGSDVGANAMVATKQSDGSCRLNGEKWFTTNVDAHLFLVSARLENGEPGTRGIGLYLVPRYLDDGTVNGIYVRRLKDKLGTKSVESAETDFRDAVAYHLGPEADGFKNMMSLVINTSRLYNAVGCSAMVQRSFWVARSYAQWRQAFGTPILQYPLIQQTLAQLRCESDALISTCMHLAALQDRVDAKQADDAEQGFFRLMLNLNKIYTAKSARFGIAQGIEVLGGNGAIETFSVLPRLLRDCIVFENWEGTHNTLLMQCMRDMSKYNVHRHWATYIAQLLSACDGLTETLLPYRERFEQEAQVISSRVAGVLDQPLEHAAVRFRPLSERMTYLTYAVVALWQLSKVKSVSTVDVAALRQFVTFRLGNWDAATPHDLADCQLLATST